LGINYFRPLMKLISIMTIATTIRM
jgi:hypothetical protein